MVCKVLANFLTGRLGKATKLDAFYFETLQGDTMNINQFLQAHKNIMEVGGYTFREHAPRVVCEDGFSMSVQVSDGHYCTPRVDDADVYSEVEIGYPSEEEIAIMPWAEISRTPTQTVYGYVPVSVVDEVIAKHGGIKNQPAK